MKPARALAFEYEISEHIVEAIQRDALNANGHPYMVRESQNALGATWEFLGPRLPQHANDLQFIQPMTDRGRELIRDLDQAKGNAFRALQFMGCAYLAGRDSLVRDFEKLMCIR